MMVDGAEEGQFRGPIDVLAPYTSAVKSSAVRWVVLPKRQRTRRRREVVIRSP